MGAHLAGNILFKSIEYTCDDYADDDDDCGRSVRILAMKASRSQYADAPSSFRQIAQSHRCLMCVRVIN